ncbi:acyl-CoA dehydrogenase family protein [Streptomyces sp. VMFN-G11Ma]|uniref:acyl-CoA dehydrogenase family protein n=1 Tax=Streptomyces sp. VMFN-G11Ma TaxID=2135609 RepID=UPI000D33EF7F|nr:acyl-CoA dehydrogenase family protein [Streptomyces sp. VMFN-G11Ma]PTM91663.1 alkylation response protein AidB-like acyl-CoA dehydrogenase [Streptomyces sp. VMFN-G11Ma]
MRFLLDAEQRDFAASLDAMLTAADTAAVVRDWSRGDHASGRALWSRIAEAGVFSLAVGEKYGGMGVRPVELAVAFVELGRHAVPGPLVETVAAAVLLAGLEEAGPAERLLPALASGKSAATLTTGRYALDADMADVALAVADPCSGAPRSEATLFVTPPPGRPDGPLAAGSPLAPGSRSPAPAARPDSRSSAGPGAAHRTPLRTTSSPTPGGPPPRPSLDPARRLFPLPSGGELLATGPQVSEAAARALLLARLSTAAQALGVGLALLDRTVAYVEQRTQFGAPIGSFQAVKHRLADAKIALEFARPLLFGAALTLGPADVAAAKVTACEAAYRTARTALQLHGAIGYTAEYDLSLWLTKARALRTAWGGPRECRALVLSGGDRRW